MITSEERALLAALLKAAWAAAPENIKARIQPLLDAAHEQLRVFLDTGQPPHDPNIPHQLLLVKSFLTDDQDGFLKRLDAQTALAAKVTVSPGGEIWGTGKYQQLDPFWVGAFAEWAGHLIFGKHKFPSGTPSIITMPSQITIALAGDFGTGNFGIDPAPSKKIAGHINSLKPDYTIHLGDVYYAGTNGEEVKNFVNDWPKGARGSFAMNSNHEMYSGGKPYFQIAVGGEVFHLQSPYSFFALENSDWIVVGLDSAYYADEHSLYMDGSLGSNAQSTFLQSLAQKGKKVIVLTHHNGLPENGSVPSGGSAPTKLWAEVMSAFQGSPLPVCWYWGHVHAGVVYKPQPNGLLCRCTGHAALPWGLASELENNPNVIWFERSNAGDPSDPARVLNGFVLLKLDGSSLSETFYNENGGVAWPANPAN